MDRGTFACRKLLHLKIQRYKRYCFTPLILKGDLVTLRARVTSIAACFMHHPEKLKNP
jgi:hypothetical protein